MKISISNLGIIDKATIDLKPLTVFIGENATGKTWTAYALAAILGSYGYEKYLEAYLNRKTQQTYPPLDNAIKQLLDECNAQIDMVQFANDYAETYINDVAQLAPSWMPVFMATRRVSFDNLQVHVYLASAKAALLDKITATIVDKKLSFGSQSKDALINAFKEAGQATLYFYSEGEILKKLPERAVKQFVSVQLFKTIHRSFYSEVYTFPTERTTFTTFPFAVEPASTSFEATFKKAEKSEIERGKTGLVEPVKDFLRLIITAALKSPTERKQQITDNPKIADYVKLAEFLETEILRGNVYFDTSGLQKELLFQANENTKLEIPIASSMIKELVPLVLYLRYLAEPNDWIIIDEPEMNLHPAVQVELAEFLAMLVNAGLHVLITTHSPYIVDHLANLMQAAKHVNKEDIKEHFYLERTDAFIPQKQVSIYLFEDGTAKNIVDEKGIIDWSTFGNVSSDVSDIYPQVFTITD